LVVWVGNDQIISSTIEETLYFYACGADLLCRLPSIKARRNRIDSLGRKRPGCKILIGSVEMRFWANRSLRWVAAKTDIKQKPSAEKNGE